MKISGFADISDGVIITGKTDFDVVNGAGGTVALNPDTEIQNVSGEFHFVPKEILFTSSSYNLTDKSNFVILIYKGTTNSTVTFDYHRHQTVYVVNTNAGVSVITPSGALEGKLGAKFYCSEELAQWIFMGTFANELV